MTSGRRCARAPIPRPGALRSARSSATRSCSSRRRRRSSRSYAASCRRACLNSKRDGEPSTGLSTSSASSWGKEDRKPGSSGGLSACSRSRSNSRPSTAARSTTPASSGSRSSRSASRPWSVAGTVLSPRPRTGSSRSAPEGSALTISSTNNGTPSAAASTRRSASAPSPFELAADAIARTSSGARGPTSIFDTVCHGVHGGSNSPRNVKIETTGMPSMCATIRSSSITVVGSAQCRSSRTNIRGW